MTSTQTFLYGLLLLGLFGWYFLTDSERTKRILGTLLTLLLVTLCIFVAYPPFNNNKDADGKIIGTPGKIHLGIDLQGGTTFLIKLTPAVDADGKKKTITSNMVEKAMEAIRKRVDELGILEMSRRIFFEPAGENKKLKPTQIFL